MLSEQAPWTLDPCSRLLMPWDTVRQLKTRPTRGSANFCGLGSSIEMRQLATRRIVRMRSIDELDYGVVSNILGLSLATTRKRHQRALIRLGAIQRRLRTGFWSDVASDPLPAMAEGIDARDSDP